MDIAPVVSVLDFEIYVLVAMKLGMINREVRMEAKLAGDGFTMRDAEAIAERVAQHEHYKFEWNGEQYGAGFSWGLFLFAARLWPED